jgi:hypothetical protein
MVVSVIGACVVMAITFFVSSDAENLDVLDRLIVGGGFIGSCLLGISLALRPGWIGRAVGRGNGPSEGHGRVGTRERRGHHPDCEKFEDHVITTDKGALCAGCTGLASGCMMAIVLMSIFVIIPARMSQGIPGLFVLLGTILIVVAFGEIALPQRDALLHATFNGLLVIGFFLVVIGVFHSTSDATSGLLAIVVSFLWLDTRIHLSNWRHTKICENCSEACKAY